MIASKLKFIQWIAWRQLTSAKGRSLSFMTIVSILGIAIGVAALVVVLSVMGGFEDDLKQKMFQGLPHLEIVNEPFAAGFSLQEHPLETLAHLENNQALVQVEPYTQADVVIKRGKHLASLTLFGVNPDLGGSLWGFSQGVIEGEIKQLLTSSQLFDREHSSAPGIILGESLSSQLGVMIGDEVRVLNPQAGATDIVTGGTFSTKFIVVGLFATDLPQFDSKYGVVEIAAGRKFMADYDPSLDEGKYVTGVAINLADPDRVDDVVEHLNLPKTLRAKTWRETNQSLLFALKLEKFTMGAILLLIVLVAAFSISGTMMMTVYHRRRYVATLRSLGMNERDIARLFLSHGFTIGTIGVSFGLCIGISICALLYWLHISHFTLNVLHTQKLPVTFLPLEYAVICVCAWALSIAAALYPALVAAKEDPGSGLRCT